MPKGFYVNLDTPEGVQRWRVAFRKMTNYGETDWGCKTIWLRPNQDVLTLADTAIHEAGGHVATGLGPDPKIEEIIHRSSASSVILLAKLGLFRNEDD
jgi:hypothetical protein